MTDTTKKTKDDYPNIHWEPIPSYGDVFTIKQFDRLVPNVIDSDCGSGYLATENEMSDVDCFKYDEDDFLKNHPIFTHVVWFNK